MTTLTPRRATDFMLMVHLASPRRSPFRTVVPILGELRDDRANNARGSAAPKGFAKLGKCPASVAVHCEVPRGCDRISRIVPPGLARGALKEVVGQVRTVDVNGAPYV